jgi:ElaA protein
VARGVAHCCATWPGRAIRIAAQAHLQAFYGGFGFMPAGAVFLDDNIPHIEMVRPPR